MFRRPLFFCLIKSEQVIKVFSVNSLSALFFAFYYYRIKALNVLKKFQINKFLFLSSYENTVYGKYHQWIFPISFSLVSIWLQEKLFDKPNVNLIIMRIKSFPIFFPFIYSPANRKIFCSFFRKKNKLRQKLLCQRKKKSVPTEGERNLKHKRHCIS